MERPNRFVVHARLGGDEVAVCHLADPGRLRELLVPEARLWLRPADESALKERKTRWSVALVAEPGGELVSVDTGVPNRLIGEALRRDALPELGEFRLERAEVPLGRSRIDFLLRPRPGEGGPPLLLEVKSVTLVEEGVGLFPDAVTARGARHVRELAGHVRAGTHRAAVLFVVQRPEVERVIAAREIDAVFADALAEAREAGVRVLGRRCRVEIDRVVLGEAIPAG